MKNKSQNNPKTNESLPLNKEIIFGKHSAISALKNSNRDIKKIIITKSTLEDIRQEIEQIRLIKPKIELKIMERSDLNKLLPENSIHQGVIIISEPLIYPNIEEIMFELENKKESCIIIIDQATDPRNIGAILRSAAAFEADCVIIQNKNSPQNSPVMNKSSCGAIDIIPLVSVVNISRTMETIKKYGFWIIGLDGHAEKTITELPLNGKICFVMGAEGSGIRNLTKENCDFLTKIPISEKMESLNLSVATSIVLYEKMKLKNK